MHAADTREGHGVEAHLYIECIYVACMHYCTMQSLNKLCAQT